jgi:hypothetical protein
MTEKLCKDCNYYYFAYGYHRCRRPVASKTNLVTGEIEVKSGYLFCDNERSHNFKDFCGTEGKFWTPRRSFWEGLSDVITRSL